MKTKIYAVGVMVGVLANFSLQAQNEVSNPAEQEKNSLEQKEPSKSRQSSSPQSGASVQQGQSVKMDELPQAVQQAFKTHAGEFNVENVKKLKIEGQTAYQASFDRANMQTQLTVAEDGSVLGVQQTRDFALGAVLPEASGAQAKMNLEDLPQPVQQTIEKVKGPKIESISKDTINGKTVYRAGLSQGPVRSDVFISETGDIVAQTQMTSLAIVPLVDSERVTLQSAPEAVQKTIKEHAGAQQITDLDRGKWKGQTAYKAKVMKDGQEQQLIVAESGKILNQSGAQIDEAAGAGQQNLQLQDLPKAAQDKVRGEIEGGKIQSIEKTTQDGQTVYNVQCEKNGEMKTLRVSEDGKILNQ